MQAQTQLSADVRGNRLRFEWLTGLLFARWRRSLLIDSLLLTVTTGVSVIVAASTGEVGPAAAIAVLGVAAAAVAGWWWLADAGLSAAFEVLMDHAIREGSAWLAETGSRLPTTVRACKRWLQEHPAGPGRSTILARLGMFTDARADLRAATPATPEEAFLIEVTVRQLDVLERRQVSTADLHESWRALPDSPDRGLRRWCLAGLDALITASDGGDPWADLTAARPDAQVIHPTVHRARYIRIVATVHVLIGITLWIVAAFVAAP